MNTKLASFEPGKEPVSVKDRLDRRIKEAAAQLVGHNPTYEDPLKRFVLLCAARTELENEPAVGTDPELQWVTVAKDVLTLAAKTREGYYPLPRLLSDASSSKALQRELYQETIASLVVVNTLGTPEIHQGTDFAAKVANSEIQIRYA